MFKHHQKAHYKAFMYHKWHSYQGLIVKPIPYRPPNHGINLLNFMLAPLNKKNQPT